MSKLKPWQRKLLTLTDSRGFYVSDGLLEVLRKHSNVTIEVGSIGYTVRIGRAWIGQAKALRPAIKRAVLAWSKEWD